MKANRRVFDAVFDDLMKPEDTSDETPNDTPLITSKNTSNESRLITPNETRNETRKETPEKTPNDTPIITSNKTPKKKFKRPSDPKTKRTFAFDTKVLNEWLELCGEDWGEQTARINALLLDDLKKRRKAKK